MGGDLCDVSLRSCDLRTRWKLAFDQKSKTLHLRWNCQSCKNTSASTSRKACLTRAGFVEDNLLRSVVVWMLEVGGWI